MLACERRVGREFPVTATANTQAMIGRRRRAPQTVERIFSRHRLLFLLLLVPHLHVLLLLLPLHPLYSFTAGPSPRAPYTTTFLAATAATTARHSFLCVVVRTVTGRQRRYSCCTAI